MLTDANSMQLFEDLQKAWVGGLRSQFGLSEDYQYMSAYASESEYEKFINIVGKDNIVFVSGSTANPKRNVVHFTIFVGPAGIENAKAWWTANTN